jgi:hypothetical protein
VSETVSDERALAIELDRALDGGTADVEMRELATLLMAAAEPTQFEIPEEELDRGLRRVQLRPRRRRWPVVAVAATALVAGTAVWLTRAPAVAVQARAARAVDATFFVVEQVRAARPGAFPTTDIAGYVDGRHGRAHIRVSTRSGLVAETLLKPDGTVERWTRATNTLTIAPSCRELTATCTDLLDPFALYVRALEDGDVVSFEGASRKQSSSTGTASCPAGSSGGRTAASSRRRDSSRWSGNSQRCRATPGR